MNQISGKANGLPISLLREDEKLWIHPTALIQIRQLVGQFIDPIHSGVAIPECLQDVREQRLQQLSIGRLGGIQ